MRSRRGSARSPHREPRSIKISTSPADAAQAFVDLVVVPSHLLQRFQRPRVGRGLGLALRGERNGLSLITGFPLGLRLDEPALLHRRHGGGGADNEADYNGDGANQSLGPSSWPGPGL